MDLSSLIFSQVIGWTWSLNRMQSRKFVFCCCVCREIDKDIVKDAISHFLCWPREEMSDRFPWHKKLCFSWVMACYNSWDFMYLVSDYVSLFWALGISKWNSQSILELCKLLLASSFMYWIPSNRLAFILLCTHFSVCPWLWEGIYKQLQITLKAF